MLKEEFSRRAKLAAKSPNPQEYMQKLFNTGIGNMYTRKYSMDDSDYAQLSSGIYSDSNATILSKILTGLPWTDGNSNKRSALGTKLMPFKLATIRSFPHIPFNGRNALTFPDVFANNKAGIPPELDSKNIWPTSEKLNKTFMKDMGMEQETIEEYFDEKDFIKLLAKSAGDKEPEAMKAGRQGGIQGVKDFIDEEKLKSKGYVPNYIGFNVPGGSHEMIDQFNAIIANQANVPKYKDLLDEELLLKLKEANASGDFSEVSDEEKRKAQMAEEIVKEAQMKQKAKMILLLKEMEQSGIKKLWMGMGGSIYPHPSSDAIPFSIQQLIGVINQSGLKSQGFVPNFIQWHDRPGGGSKIPKPDNPGLFTKEEVDELKSMGYKRTDHHGWHYAEPVGLEHTPPTQLSPFGLAGPVSFDFLSRMIQHDREAYNIPNPVDDNANLDQLGQSLIKGQKNAAIIGYDSSVNRMQLIEGNHRVAALARLNDDRDKTQKFYTGMHAFVSGVPLRSPSQMDHSVGFVNKQIAPPKVPDDVIEAMKDPYRAPGQYVQGSWSPDQFGIPNFADFWDNPYFKNKQQTIIDKSTGTSLKYRTLTPDYAEITHAVRGEKDIKGGAFRNFNTLMGQYDSVGSGMLTPHRAGFGPTSWAKIITMFPQIKQRIQPGLRTLGDFAVDDTEMDFESLVQLKKKTNKFFKDDPNADAFLTNFGNGPFFDDGKFSKLNHL